MTEPELLAILQAEEEQSEGRASSTLSEERKKALDYFNGSPFGNEIAGRSQVVSTEVSDTILWILPSLMRIFTAGDDVVEFEPNGPEDEEGAKQATDYVNWVFTRQNAGFLFIHNLFFDALLQKNGFGKAWWEEREVTDIQERTVAVEAATAMIAQLMQDGYEIDEAEPVEAEPGDDAEPQQMPGMNGAPPMADALMPSLGKLRIKASRTKKEGKVRVENVPPEEILISRRARRMIDAPFIAHKTPRTISSLIADGYDAAKVKSMVGPENKDSMEEQARRNDLDPTRTDSTSADPSMREVDVTEAYVLIDCDGDDIAERRQIFYGGKVVLSNEPWDGPIPLIGATPILLPHRVYGMSIADLVMDLQLIKSTLWRQTLDNLYLSNNPRNVVSDKVNLDDLLTVRPGGIVRLTVGTPPDANHVIPLVVPFVAGATFPMFEYIDTVKENRTGVTRYNQGVDADSLNKTAHGINQIMQAAQQRIELIARILAETGIKDLFKLILFLVNKHVDKAQVIRLRNKWTQVDPSQWRTLFDVRIDVALGTGNRDQIAAHLTNMMMVQEKIVAAQQGMGGPLVTWEELSNAARKLGENTGFKNPELFVKEFGPEEAQAWAQQQQGQPDPAMQMAQAEMEIEKMKAQVQAAIDQQAAQADLAAQQQQTQAEIQAQAQKSAADIAVAREKAAAEIQTKVMLANVQARLAEMSATVKANIAQQAAKAKAAQPKPKANGAAR